jgi:flagellar biosynthesis protein FlhF
MQVKVFEAPDMASGLRQIRRELGPDALILSTRTVKNGRLGLLGKHSLEITAAIDTPWPDKCSPADASSRAAAGRAYTRNNEMESNTADTAPSLPPISFEPVIPAPSATKEKAADGPATEAPALRQEVDELRSLVKNLAGEISRLGVKEPTTPRPVRRSVIQSLEDKLRSSRSGNRVEEILLSQGVDAEASRIISAYAGERLNTADFDDPEKIYGFLHETIADILTVNPPDFEAMDSQKRIALVGPTGVGKTTTLAKIAARYLATRSNSICFITIDTYRIAAVEQLKVYGEIMHLPVEVVLTPQQLRDALAKHNEKDLILIDTAGRSPRDSLSIEEIRTFLAPDLAIESHLVLSAATRDNELMEIFAQFKNIPVHNTIFTKIDECSNFGTLLNMQVQNGSPYSYITNGQRVPEDIMEADPEQLAQLIIPSPFGIVHD